MSLNESLAALENPNINALQCFIYILLRDHLPSGVVHGILIDHTSKSTESIYSNPFLAEESRVIAEAILRHSTFEEILNEESFDAAREIIEDIRRMEQIEKRGDWRNLESTMDLDMKSVTPVYELDSDGVPRETTKFPNNDPMDW